VYGRRGMPVGRLWEALAARRPGGEGGALRMRRLSAGRSERAAIVVRVGVTWFPGQGSQWTLDGVEHCLGWDVRRVVLREAIAGRVRRRLGSFYTGLVADGGGFAGTRAFERRRWAGSGWTVIQPGALFLPMKRRNLAGGLAQSSGLEPIGLLWGHSQGKR